MANKRETENRNTANGVLIGSYALDSADAARAKIAAARKAQGPWASMSYAARSACVKRLGAIVAERADELAAVISANNGKTLVDAMATEVLPAILAVGYYRRRGARLCASRRLSGGSILMFNKRSRLLRAPYGVVGIISPWNYPFSIPFSEAVMALLAGNAVVLKVASDSLAVGAALTDCFRDALFPEGLFAYLNLPGKEAGDALIEGGIDKLFFTGSTEVGRELMAKAAPKLLPLVLELGGNDAAIIRADADLDRAASGIAWASFSNCGQSCGGAQRVLIQEAAYAGFVAKLKAKVEALRVGPGSSMDSDMGCMTSARQKETVERQIAACLAGGAHIIARSPLPKELEGGNFMSAIVLEGAAADSPAMREEIFGPVVSVQAYKDDDEAIRIANDSSLGLTASVWSRDHRRAKAMASRMKLCKGMFAMSAKPSPRK